MYLVKKKNCLEFIRLKTFDFVLSSTLVITAVFETMLTPPPSKLSINITLISSVIVFDIFYTFDVCEMYSRLRSTIKRR